MLVTVKSGSDLKSSDVNGKSDPYCKLRMGVQTHLTKVKKGICRFLNIVITSATLNPVWNESFMFCVSGVCGVIAIIDI